MLDIVFARVYFRREGGWAFTALIDGKMVERAISEYDAMGLAESILTAAKRKSDPEPEKTRAAIGVIS